MANALTWAGKRSLQVREEQWGRVQRGIKGKLEGTRKDLLSEESRNCCRARGNVASSR